MAGSGKTTLIHRLSVELHQRQLPSYFINMDPAVSNIPYHPNIDIRDTVFSTTRNGSRQFSR